MLARLDAGGIDGAVRLVSDVENHDGAVVAAHRQQGVVHRVKVEAHNLFRSVQFGILFMRNRAWRAIYCTRHGTGMIGVVFLKSTHKISRSSHKDTLRDDMYTSSNSNFDRPLEFTNETASNHG